MNAIPGSVVSPQQITLEVLGPAHTEEATACIANTFAAGEPMSQHLGITSEEFTQFARLFIEKAAHEGLSAVALDPEQQIVGTIIAEDYATEPPAGLKDISEKFTPVFALLESLGERYVANHAVTVGSHCHLFMCGVYPAYTNRRLAQKLIQFAQDIARERGFKTAVCEATGRISQFMCGTRLGFNYLDEINYQNFLLDGKAVFADITSVDSCILYEKHL